MTSKTMARLAVLLTAFVVFLSPAWAEQGDLQILTTPAGIEVWLKEEPSIPIVSFNIAFRGGASLDPEGKEGLANMVSGLLDEGAGELDSQAFQERLDELSIRMSFDIGRDAFYGSLTTLKAGLDDAADLFHLALTAPTFHGEPVERIRGQILVGLLRESEDPDAQAWRAWSAAAFPGHVYGRPTDGTAESVGAITQEDLVGFVAENFTRDRLLVAVVGDISAERTMTLVDGMFAELPATGAPLDIPDVTPATGETIIIEMDVPQSAIVFGLPGLDRHDPDFYAGYVLNKALGGGGLNTRFFEEIRKARGLAYSASSFLYAYDHAGLWLGATGTQNARAGETLDLVREILADVAETGITQAELDDARDYLTGSFPLHLDSNDAIAGMLLSIQMDDLGEDYIEARNGYIEAVTAEDVKRVAQRLLDADDLLVVVAGMPEGITPSEAVD
jgi:zinc protease